MFSWIFTGGIALIWASALFNGTGLGNAYHTDQITFALLCCTSIIVFLMSRTRIISRDVFQAFGGMIIVFVASSLLHGFGLKIIKYFSCFLMVYILSNVKISTRSIRLAAMAVLLLGISILVIFDYGSQLSGWNGNSIAMIGLFSYLIFVTAFWNEKLLRYKLLILIIGSIEFWLIAPTDSRSCQVALIMIGLLIILGSKPKFIQSKWQTLGVIMLPLVVAVVTVLLSSGGIVGQLDTWSRETFNKPIFNGRDETWHTGFQMLWQNLLFGNGNIDTLRWHNSSITCLVSFGVVGYSFWTYGLYVLLKRSQAYIDDSVVMGCTLCFLLMNTQQSVELGMFTQNPNLLIYLPLGLMLGRIKYLKEYQE